MDVFGVVFDVLLAIALIISWKVHFFPAQRLRSNRGTVVWWCLLMCICAAAIYVVLRLWSASDVREDGGAITEYFVFSLFWVFAAQGVFGFCGVSLRDDVVERGNRGAGFTIAGLMIGATCCVAGSNVGNGPGFAVVLFCAAISTGALLVLWTVFAAISNAAEAITIECDAGAGLRAGTLLAGSGAVMGASVAGDWVSVAATLTDFAHYAGPIVGVWVLLTFVERHMSQRRLAARLGLGKSAILAAGVIITTAAYAIWVVKQ